MDKILKTVKKINDSAEIGIVLGSGYRAAMPALTNVHEVDYLSCGIPYTKVEGHERKFIFGDYNGKRILIFSRLHYYETGTTEYINLLYKVISKLGVKTLISTTATGAVSGVKVGDIMVVTDHKNLSGQCPLVGSKPIDFIELNDCYSPSLIKLVKKLAKKENIELKTGVHAQLIGPNYETPAEVKMLKILGVNTVSMSPILDMIMAKSLGMDILLLAGVGNEAGSKTTHKEVLELAAAICGKVKVLLKDVLDELTKK